MAIYAQFMSKLADFIEASDLPQIHWAKEFGVSQPHISDLVGGRRKPSLALAVSISDKTGIPIRDLLPSAESASPPSPPSSQEEEAAHAK